MTDYSRLSRDDLIAKLRAAEAKLERHTEALRQAQERLELVVEGADAGFYDANLRTGETAVNERYLQILGYAPGELAVTVQGWRDRIHPEDLPRIVRACEGTEPNRALFDQEYRVRHKSGNWIWVLDRGKGFDWDERGRPRRAAGIYLDITERKRIETALRESEERFRLFMDHSPTVAWIKNEEGRYVYLSHTFQQRFGARIDEWRGKTDFEVWPADTAEKFRRDDLAALAADQPLEIEDETQEAHGVTTYWHTMKIPFQNDSGHRFVGGIGVDITARKRAESELCARETLLRTIMDNSPDPISGSTARAACSTPTQRP